MSLDFSRCRLPPFAHQREDVAWLMERPYAFITSEMRTGKTKIVIDAAQFLHEQGVIDRVLVIAPAPVRDVWFDKQLGEIAKHAFANKPMIVSEFHSRLRSWSSSGQGRVLDWMITNYEFIRSKNRLIQLLPYCGPKTLLVLDESSFVKNHAAEQAKACLQLRRACGRVVLLNGTPLFHSPLDLFSQGNLLDVSILACPYITHFKARYAQETAVLGSGGKILKSPYGRAIMKITGWHESGLADLQRRFAPVTVRRLQKECLDLPPKLDPVTLTATLDAEWKPYKEMRDEMVVWLQSGDVATSTTAAIKALRLSQITGGFLGGVEGANIDEQLATHDLIDNIDFGPNFNDTASALTQATEREYASSLLENEQHNAAIGTLASQEIGRAKLDVLLWFLGQHLEADAAFKVVTWFRFRPELLRAVAEVRKAYPQFAVGELHGGQKKQERLDTMRLLHPDTAPAGPVFVGGIEGTGSFGLNFTAAHTSIDYSSGYSPGRWAQKSDRTYGPGQTSPCAYFDIVAVGPKMQKTIDHSIIAARRAGQDVASWTSAAWVKALTDEG